MGLWQFVIAQGVKWKDHTKETEDFLNKISLEELQRLETWRLLNVLVQVQPQDEIYPVRARYGDDIQYTIGTNYLESEHPLWYTLADCISAKLLSGKTPKVLKAIIFTPGEVQKGLLPKNIMGDHEYHLDPLKGDFFKRLIDLRAQIKEPEKQLAVKTIANSTSYGIFIEILVKQDRKGQNLLCHGPLDKPFLVKQQKIETPGVHFHPLLATLITGAARLMLAITERLALDAGLNWAFCDTDSMALAKPEAMPQEQFYQTADQVRSWFNSLNPYADQKPLFKVEDANYCPNTKKLHPLFCLAVSSKRYALFNLDNNKPKLRKVSGHGLGHLLAPYKRARNPWDLKDVELWQQDLWMEILKATLRGKPNQPNYGRLPGFNKPAASHYTATTPALERWFKHYNHSKAYPDQVKPFNFLCAAQIKGPHEIRENNDSYNPNLRPVAPFSKDIKIALQNCFDRITGRAVSYPHLKTYRGCLSRYHLHPESKFLGGDYTDSGFTQRKHIKATAIQHIGKEANQWEEQYFLGFNPDALIEYGTSKEQQLKILHDAKKTFGLRKLAAEAGCAVRHLNDVIRGKVTPGAKTLVVIHRAIGRLSLKICNSYTYQLEKNPSGTINMV